jgi:hypothetical protein
MALKALGRCAAVGLLLAAGACGGRVEVESGSAAAGHSEAVGGRPEGGAPTPTTVGSSTGGSSSGDSSPPGSSTGGSPEPLCNGGVCPSVLCTDGSSPVRPPNRCCPMCADSTDGMGSLPPPNEKCLATLPEPLPCSIPAADTACTVDADCIPQVAPASCGATCLKSVYAVNVASTATCDPCPPDPDCHGQFEYMAQDCRLLVMGEGAFSAKCVAANCVSYALP